VAKAAQKPQLKASTKLVSLYLVVTENGPPPFSGCLTSPRYGTEVLYLILTVLWACNNGF